jgi:hypothetical protein
LVDPTPPGFKLLDLKGAAAAELRAGAKTLTY